MVLWLTGLRFDLSFVVWVVWVFVVCGFGLNVVVHGLFVPCL